MTSKELTDQGIAALKDGDESRAHDLLQRAVELDAKNAKAWYFLSRTQTTTADKRVSLEHVLAIMPNNKPAREALEKLPADDAADDVLVYDDEPIENTYMPPVSMGVGTGVKPRIGNFELPVAIPDAPAYIDPRQVKDDFIAMFKSGIEVLRRTPDVYAIEVRHATWWRFWQYVVIALVIGVVSSTIAGLMIRFQMDAYQNSSAFPTEVAASPSALAVILTPFLILPLSILALYIGLYTSHRFVTTNHNGNGSFIAHAYAVMLPVVTAQLIGDMVTLIFSFAPLLGLLVIVGLVVLWVYSLYIASQGIVMVHGVPKQASYWTIAMLVGVQLVTSFLVYTLLGPFLLTSGLGFI